MGGLVRLMHQIFYGLGASTQLSALSSIDVQHLIALPLGGFFLGVIAILTRGRTRQPVDVVEANALHGGRIPVEDTTLVVAQTVVSSGMGASVGLEAAYAQTGGGFASVLGQWLNLRRADLRMLVGAGAGAAIAAAFAAPLAGSFYAFEIVIGAYTPASIAAVATACVSAVVTANALGAEPYLLVAAAGGSSTVADYALYAGLGLVCGGLGVLLMRLVSLVENSLRRLPVLDVARPFVGGLLLMPIAWASPHALSAGHGGLHLTTATQLALSSLLFIFAMKSLASIVSLGFGFRGGLFFASLFLGAFLGQIFSDILELVPGLHPLPLVNAALVGMAAFAVAVIGGPMTMSLLILEQTHNFGLTSMVLTAALFSSSIGREWFG
jgi:CIC family chloride channel protein